MFWSASVRAAGSFSWLKIFSVSILALCAFLNTHTYAGGVGAPGRAGQGRAGRGQVGE